MQTKYKVGDKVKYTNEFNLIDTMLAVGEIVTITSIGEYDSDIEDYIYNCQSELLDCGQIVAQCDLSPIEVKLKIRTTHRI